MINRIKQKLCRELEKSSAKLVLNGKSVKLPYITGIVGGVSRT